MTQHRSAGMIAGGAGLCSTATYSRPLRAAFYDQ
jgi:hypothetical protein